MKRLVDFMAALAGLLLLWPLILLLMLLVRLFLGSPIFFKQLRPGRGGHVFQIIKFRTMLNAKSAEGRMLPDEERLTRFGRSLRSTSLDELPELWNVLRGDMSLVGPRPLLLNYLDCYTADQARRHEVRPGITGLAQVNGRNALNWPDKFALDVWYVDNRSLWLDLRILVATVLQVFGRRGISSEGHATMPEFTGSTDAGDSIR